MKNLRRNYKHSFYLLLGLSPLVLILVWNFSIGNTLSRFHEYKQLNSRSKRYSDPKEVIRQLGASLQSYERFISDNQEDADILMIDLVGSQTGKYHVQLLNIPEVHQYRSGNFIIYTYRLVFSGSFRNLTRFTEYIEKNIPWCKVISVNFNRVYSRGKASEELNMEIALQSLFKNPE